MPLIPKLVTTLRGYDRAQLLSDAFAGGVVGVVAIPLALAFAIASGVAPERGLYTAIVAGFLISALGGSRVQIGGPTGAFVVIVYGIVRAYGFDGLAACTVMAGGFLIVMGLARLGTMIKFIPFPVITGFTSGIAVVIFSSQVKDLFGLHMAAVPAEFVAKWRAYAGAAGTTEPATAALALATVVLLAVWPRLSRTIPGPIVALLAGTGAAAALGLPVETIGSRFGALPRTLPHLALPSWPLARLHELVRPAFTVALLAAIESLLSAMVSDGMIGGRHRSNMELVAQGVANLASPLFGGIPATGAIARTVTNIKCGGRTPVAGMIHALILALALAALGPWIARVPLCVLAAILVLVSYHMSEWRNFLFLLKAPRSDRAVLVVTFLLTVFVDLTVAVEVGMVLSAFLFMRRMAESTQVQLLAQAAAEDVAPDPAAPALPPGIDAYRIQGPFFFGAARRFREALTEVQRRPRALIVEMSEVPFIDATGLRAMQELQERCRRERIVLVLAGLREAAKRTLEEAELLERFDAALPRKDLREAIRVAEAKLAA